MFTQQQTETINTFADTHGLTLGTVERFAEELCKANPSRYNGGRKMSEESKALLQSLKGIAPTFKDEFLCSDMATRFSAPAAYVANALNKLEKDGVVQRTGKRDKLPGEKGKKCVTWKFI